MSDETITFVVLGAAVALFVWDRLPVAVVAVGVALSLWATGVLSLEQALAGFGDPTVIFIAAGPGARRALLVLAAMVVLLATGALPPAVAGLLAAGALVVTGVLSIEQAYRGIGWTTVILVAGMIPLATAMTSTGAAQAPADGLVDVVGDAGPRALLLGLVLLVFVLGQLISNMATALIVIPIAVSAAAELDVSPKPLLVGVAVAAAAAFLTPVATPANLMVMGPGGYRFGDYWKLGLPLLALFGVVAVLLVPVFWSF